MDKFLKDNILSCYSFIRNQFNMTSTTSNQTGSSGESSVFFNTPQNYKIVEKKRKVYYFSKYSGNAHEVFKIVKTIKQIKESLFKSLLDAMKYCSTEYLQFNKVCSEREKVLILFTICYTSFYYNFNYDENITFEDYFNQKLINNCSKFGVFVKNLSQFKLFCYAFYLQLNKEVKKVDYSELRRLYTYFNPGSNEIYEESEKNSVLNFEVASNFSCVSNNKSMFEKIMRNYTALKENSYNTFSKLNELVTSNFFVPLMSSTERVVDMVLSINKKASLINNQNSSELKLRSSVTKQLQQKANEEKEEANTDGENVVSQGKVNNDSMYIDDCSLDKSENTKNTSTSIREKEREYNALLDDIASECDDFKVYSKRILCELTKNDCEDCEKEWVTNLANNLNPILEIIINKGKAKLNIMQRFITYFVEIGTDLIQNLPEYKELKEDLVCRFIITAKNVYYFACEVYFSLYDLYNIDLGDLTSIFKQKCSNGLIPCDERLLKAVLSFFKLLSEELLKNNLNQSDESIFNILDKFNQMLNDLWSSEIVSKGSEFTKFYSI